jgi:hypothetical protein
MVCSRSFQWPAVARSGQFLKRARANALTRVGSLGLEDFQRGHCTLRSHDAGTLRWVARTLHRQQREGRGRTLPHESFGRLRAVHWSECDVWEDGISVVSGRNKRDECAGEGGQTST